MIKAVILDMDGTMFDTERLSTNAWTYTGEQLGFSITPSLLSQIRGTNKQHAKEVFMDAFGKNFTFEKAYQIRSDFISDYILTKGVPVKKGLLELLQYLKEHHFKIGVATSSERKKVMSYFTSLSIESYFDAIVTGDMVLNGKPAPDIYLKAAESLNISPQDCIGIEDSYNGVLSVYHADMKPVLIPDLEPLTKEIEPLLYAKVDSLFDILSLLEELKKR